ncbi:hypothetical protein [Demequina gelatinilytica]|uniref:hypothetical protein n=1 Tax=Demequina gelatinilytica TaxID=1638980 RepID=UPI00078487A4|nr:hypothetical protein [Demequina gelatinilytica]
MKGLREPVGEHPAEVYWRRRIVLVVAIVVIVLVGRLIWSAVASGSEPGTDDAGGSEPTVTETADAPADDAAGDEGDDGATVTEVADQSGASAEPTVDAEEPAAAIGACEQGDISVALGETARVGAEAVAFDVTLTQTGDEACLLDASTGKSSLLITSGDTRIWSSSDCKATATLADKEWLLDSGKSKTFEVSWPREWSSEGCGTPSNRAPQPGTYWAQLTFQGQTAERIPFVLS